MTELVVALQLNDDNDKERSLAEAHPSLRHLLKPSQELCFVKKVFFVLANVPLASFNHLVVQHHFLEESASVFALEVQERPGMAET